MDHDPPTASLGPNRDQGAPGLSYRPGDLIGRYTIRRSIGEGGFGIVYEAEQAEPVSRRVALKVIRPGMDSGEVLARFEAERQALALMDHPNIAKVFDGGVTPEGRPYFVMEMVRGIALTDHCDRHRLSLTERLKLFMTICGAVQHAHTKGIVHRDIKPSNILVSYEDGKSVPKIIDFGVAKALHAPLTAHDVFTQVGQLIGTPEYMSPEQAEMGVQDIDTRSDIYSLGVVLYELLAGSRPFESETLRSAGYGEIQRIIREVDPPRPSTRLSTARPDHQDTVSKIVSARRTDSHALSRVLRRDLDWVVMRCLEKDRERRYPAASEISEDIRRFLENEPVSAGPPSAAYRASKFARRHRVAVGIAAAAVAGLFLLTGVMWISAQRESRLRREAETQRLAAERASRTSAAVTEYFKDSLGAAAPDTLGIGVTIAEVLHDASERVSLQFADEPSTESAVRHALGQTWLELGDLASAETQLRRAREVREATHGPNDPTTLETIAALIELGWRRGSAEESARLADLLAERTAKVFGDDSAEYASALDLVASSNKYAGDAESARDFYEQSLAVRATLGQRDAPEALWSEFNIALLAVNDGEYQRAISIFDRILTVTKASDRGVAELRVSTAVERATVIYRMGEYERAHAALAPAIAQMDSVLGQTHWRTREAKANLASLSVHLGMMSEAEHLYREVLPGYRRVRGATHPHTIIITNRLAALAASRGNIDEACTLVKRTLRELESQPRVDQNRVSEQRTLLGDYCASGDP
ncbi:MAG: protein kinase [Phycisphaerales bacterium]